MCVCLGLDEKKNDRQDAICLNYSEAVTSVLGASPPFDAAESCLLAGCSGAAAAAAGSFDASSTLSLAASPPAFSFACSSDLSLFVSFFLSFFSFFSFFFFSS